MGLLPGSEPRPPSPCPRRTAPSHRARRFGGRAPGSPDAPGASLRCTFTASPPAQHPFRPRPGASGGKRLPDDGRRRRVPRLRRRRPPRHLLRRLHVLAGPRARRRTAPRVRALSREGRRHVRRRDGGHGRGRVALRNGLRAGRLRRGRRRRHLHHRGGRERAAPERRRGLSRRPVPPDCAAGSGGQEGAEHPPGPRRPGRTSTRRRSRSLVFRHYVSGRRRRRSSTLDGIRERSPPGPLVVSPPACT